MCPHIQTLSPWFGKKWWTLCCCGWIVNRVGIWGHSIVNNSAECLWNERHVGCLSILTYFGWQEIPDIFFYFFVCYIFPTIFPSYLLIIWPYLLLCVHVGTLGCSCWLYQLQILDLVSRKMRWGWWICIFFFFQRLKLRPKKNQIEGQKCEF